MKLNELKSEVHQLLNSLRAATTEETAVTWMKRAYTAFEACEQIFDERTEIEQMDALKMKISVLEDELKAVYFEKAEAKLLAHSMELRWSMRNRECNKRTAERAEIAYNLKEYGLLLMPNGTIQKQI